MGFWPSGEPKGPQHLLLVALRLWKRKLKNFMTWSIGGLSALPSATISLSCAMMAGCTPQNHPATKIFLGSCSSVRLGDQWHWDEVRSKGPDAWVWLGDTVYGDAQNFAGMSLLGGSWKQASPQFLRKLYAIQKKQPGYAKLLESGVPIYGVWDDHDYGQDNSDRNYPHKVESQKAFLDFLDVTKNSPLRTREGVYSTHTLDNGRIRLIFLDVRYHRTPYGDPEGDFLGEQQWEWFSKVLNTSTAQVNIIAGGIQFLAPRTSFLTIPVAESWSRFPEARRRLLSVILASGVRSPVLLSGDVHFAEISEAVCHQIGNAKAPKRRLIEVTSSGLTHSWGTEGWLVEQMLFGFLSMPGYQDYTASKIVTAKNYGELQIRLDEPEASMLVLIHGDDGKLHVDNNYYLNDLSGEGGGHWECVGVNRD